MHKDIPCQNSDISVCTACAQSGHNHPASARITTKDTHKAICKFITAVHKVLVYTPASAQTRLSKQPTYTLIFTPFYRLKSKVIRSMHRAYIYDQTFNLMNI